MALTDLRNELVGAFPTAELRAWGDVSKLLEVTSKFNGRPWLFRGAGNETYTLTPKVGRDERKLKSAGRIPYSLEDEKAVLYVFKLRARALISTLAPQNDLEWLALAQHHGAPTRLLDWTEGLLSALWFAGEVCVADEPVSGAEGKLLKRMVRNGCLWCAWDVPPVSNLDVDNPFIVEKVGAYRPAHFDRRISAQQSVFTLQPTPTNSLPYDNIFKFTVASKFKFALRKRLDAAGVNQRALFPDLAGLGEDSAWRYKNNWLGAYREDACLASDPVEDDPDPIEAQGEGAAL